ncbi:MAG: hypothetical protein ABJP48_09625 [Erythrobacter sp.]
MFEMKARLAKLPTKGDADTPPWVLAKTASNEQSPIPKGKQIAVYDPYSPTVFFGWVRRGFVQKFARGRFAKFLSHLPRKRANPATSKSVRQRIIGKENGRCLLDSGLIIPSQKDVFLLTRPQSGEDYLLSQRRERQLDRQQDQARSHQREDQ